MTTASADAEPVAWLYTHPGAKPLLRHSRFPMSVPGWTEIPLYTEAQMQARADAARREALDGLPDEVDIYRAMKSAPSCKLIDLVRTVSTLLPKENPNAG